MKTLLLATLAVVALSGGAALAAGRPNQLEPDFAAAVRDLEEAPLERSIGSRPRMQIEATEDQAALAIQYGWTRSYGTDFRGPTSAARFTTFSLGASLPFADGAKTAGLDALASGSSGEIKYASTRISRAQQGNTDDLQMGFCARKAGIPVAEVQRCSAGELAPEDVAAFQEFIWGRKPTLTTWGVGARAATETFDYLDTATLAERSVDKSSWSVKAFWAYRPLDSKWLVTASFEHQDAYEAADDAILCPPGAAVADDCVYGPAGTPKATKKDILSGEYRHDFGDFAISGILQYDANNDVFAAEVPIFLSRGDDGAFNSGVKVSWRSDTDDVTAAIFVGVPFSLGVPTN